MVAVVDPPPMHVVDIPEFVAGVHRGTRGTVVIVGSHATEGEVAAVLASHGITITETQVRAALADLG